MKLMNAKRIPLVSFLLIHDDCVLAEVRKKSNDIGAGAIWLPGGHVDEDESDEAAFKRELKEELNLTPTQFLDLVKLPWEHDGKSYTIHYFLVTQWEGTMQNNEAEKLIWVHPSNINQLNEKVDQKAFKHALKISQRKPVKKCF